MKKVSFDPRTKMLLLVLCVLSTMFAPSLIYEQVLVCLIAIFCLIAGKYWYATKGVVIYGIIYGITQLSVYQMTGIWQSIFVAFMGLVNKVYPCGFLAGFMISTTKIGEFMAAFGRMHMPKQFMIPFAVMLRYLPVVREDWQYIKDAMRMRDIAPSLKNTFLHPVEIVECLYVPLMMAAANTADELSMASVTRGIENPNPRTCLSKIQFSWKDILVSVVFFGYFVSGVLLERGII